MQASELQILNSEIRLVPVRRAHLERGLQVDFALAGVVEFDPDPIGDLVGVLGFPGLLIILLGVSGKLVVADSRSRLQQERVEDGRFARAVRADEYNEPCRFGQVSDGEIGEPFVVVQVYFL